MEKDAVSKRAAGALVQISFTPTIGLAAWAQAPEGRKSLAHGVSRGYARGLPSAPQSFFSQSSFAPPGLFTLVVCYPRLTPWAKFCRPIRGLRAFDSICIAPQPRLWLPEWSIEESDFYVFKLAALVSLTAIMQIF